MDEKTRPIYKLPRPLQTQRHIQAEVKGWTRIFHVNGNQKKARVSVLISDKIDFKNILRDKGEHYVTIKESIQEESE